MSAMRRKVDARWAVVCIVTDACVPLENHVAANYTVLLEENFYKKKLRL